MKAKKNIRVDIAVLQWSPGEDAQYEQQIMGTEQASYRISKRGHLLIFFFGFFFNLWVKKEKKCEKFCSWKAIIGVIWSNQRKMATNGDTEKIVG